jgi:hypothetical protein
MVDLTPPDVASATLVECHSGWRLKVTFMGGKAVDKGAYPTREDALRALDDLLHPQDRAEAAAQILSRRPIRPQLWTGRPTRS